MNWYTEVIKKYAVFGGRARRKEFWCFTLFDLVITALTVVVDIALGLPVGLYFIYMMALLIPRLAVLVRRLHDTGRSGWWLLIGFIPLIGAIVLLVFAVQDSSPGGNQYGPNPKGAVA